MAFALRSASLRTFGHYSVLILSAACLMACSGHQVMADAGAGVFGTSHQALYRQMDEMREYSCKPLGAGMSPADSRNRTEELAREWSAIEQGVAAEREEDREKRSDQPRLSTALSSYWAQWQKALSSRQLCFDVDALSPPNLQGGSVRANGSGSWVVVLKTGDQPAPMPDSVLLACSTPENNSRSFERCAIDKMTAEAAHK